ncbi:hypothetical protein [Arcticibacterium luteifluviistationis]|uniref:HEAT repeat domain-containing protein n=1 Tax=Arcticibacterium luteifluviistationis TaxID=1784714 RepID=A0A2Z4GBJ7_9BACT|nr:hypothetical protein [Arcticibacterium luteifluviistationis]AWV98669.1 hypothetical protein DJ013_11000 [Arcticibacterium luteifluviistationis]
MNIRGTLLRDRSKATCARIVAYIGHDADRCQEWADCFFSDDIVLSQKAAWVLHFITDETPEIVKVYQEDFLEKLKEPDLHDAVVRAICRHWGDYGYTEVIEGKVYDLCLNYLQDKSSIGIKAHAMYACQRLVKKYPELKQEFKLVLEEMLLKYGEESPAIRSRSTKILKRL